MNEQTNTPSANNLVDAAAANGNFKTFGEAIEKAALTDTLRGPGAYTVFAPTDAAFKKLPQGKLEYLFKPENKEELVGVLNYHVLKGQKSSADIGKWKSARMVQGQSAPITLMDGKVSIDGANVTVADIASSNGVIHGIDKVNIPAPTKH
jgi:uncharacterized surface protein with fasciclin (FAS1) repeats